MYLYSRSPGLALEQCKLLLKFGKEHGVLEELCLAKTSIAAKDFLYHNFEPSEKQELQIIENLCRNMKSSSERIGYEVGIKSSLNTLGLIGQAMLSSKNLGHALEIAARYCQEDFHLTRCASETIEDCIAVTWSPISNIPTEIDRFLVARDVGTCIAIVRLAAGSKPIQIHSFSTFFHDRSVNREISEALNCPVNEFEAGARLLVTKEQAKLRMPFQNPQTSEIIEKHCYATLERKSTRNKSSDLIERAAELLHSHQYLISRDEIADALNISPRTLTRHLTNQNTTWRKFVTDLRLKQAKRLMLESSQNIEQISTSLGFSSLRAFEQAFSNATGQTPQEYRKACLPKKEVAASP